MGLVECNSVYQKCLGSQMRQDEASLRNQIFQLKRNLCVKQKPGARFRLETRIQLAENSLAQMIAVKSDYQAFMTLDRYTSIFLKIVKNDESWLQIKDAYTRRELIEGCYKCGFQLDWLRSGELKTADLQKLDNLNIDSSGTMSVYGLALLDHLFKIEMGVSVEGYNLKDFSDIELKKYFPGFDLALVARRHPSYMTMIWIIYRPDSIKIWEKYKSEILDAVQPQMLRVYLQDVRDEIYKADVRTNRFGFDLNQKLIALLGKIAKEFGPVDQRKIPILLSGNDNPKQFGMLDLPKSVL